MRHNRPIRLESPTVPANIGFPFAAVARTFVVACAVVVVVLLGAARPAAAATPCWKALLNDWYDGRIDKTYAIHCYTDALKHLPPDVTTYSSAHDDIERALQSAIAKRTKAGKRVTPNTPIVPPATTTVAGGTGTGAKRSGGSGSSSGPGLTGGGTTTSTPSVGRKEQHGLARVADKLNPGSADSFPVPLLVLGALAILLVAAGAAGLVVKRIQARRPGS